MDLRTTFVIIVVTILSKCSFISAAKDKNKGIVHEHHHNKKLIQEKHREFDTFDEEHDEFLHVVLTLESQIPEYSGIRLFEHTCDTDEVAHLMLMDIQLSPTQKANYLHNSLCRRQANLECDNITKKCVCMRFGDGPIPIWDQIKVRCLGQVGSSCKTLAIIHPGISFPILHRTECIQGASCEDFVYDTTSVCQCEIPDPKNKLKCIVTSNQSSKINLNSKLIYYFLIIILIFLSPDFTIKFKYHYQFELSWFISLPLVYFICATSVQSKSKPKTKDLF